MKEQSTKRVLKSTSLFAVSTLLIGIAAACHHGAKDKQKSSPSPTGTDNAGVLPQTEVKVNEGIVIHRALPVSQMTSEGLEIGNGLKIPTISKNGQSYIQIHATFDPASFRVLTRAALSTGTSVNQFLSSQTNKTAKTFQADLGLINLKSYPEIGYLTGFIPLSKYESLTNLKNLPGNVLVAPMIVDTKELSRIQDFSKDMNANTTLLDRASFSGLNQTGAPEFLKTVEAELNQVVDGGLVTVGIVDTGITLNHPAFENKQGESRISYLKDFTNESRIFINPASELQVKLPEPKDLSSAEKAEDYLLVKGNLLVSPAGQNVQPAATDFVALDWTKIKTNPQLRSKLLDASSGAKLGLIKEDVWSPEPEPIDINQNGKLNDNFLVIAFYDEDPSKAEFYVDLSGLGDFTKSPSLKNFNSSKTTQTIGSEKIALEVEKVVLQSASSEEGVLALAASIVGFDAGNHGSHVAGIISAKKTISNDADDTLARGAAPAATLMSGRACGQHGGCVGSLLGAIDLSLAGAEIVNMSLGGLSPFNDGYGIEETIINRLTETKNTLFVISAGNSGPGRNTVGSPSTAALALSVGATATKKMIQKQYQWPAAGKASDNKSTDEDFQLFFSSRGPNAAGGFKPNISAPGTQLSSIQLNGALGFRSGLDVYWGTSMAAPAAAGSAALLLDAVKRYNIKYPSRKLPSDAISLRKALLEGARPFDVESLNTSTGKSTAGQYTWIDQGLGMVSLPGAWQALIALRDTKLASAVNLPEIPGSSDTAKPVALRYEPRVTQFNNPNGVDYSGGRTVDLPVGIDPDGAVKQVRAFGQGLWFKSTEPSSLFEIQIARRLPEWVEQRSDAGEALRQLKTTSDQFEFETVIYGSQQKWLNVGVLNGLDCQKKSTTTQNPQIEVIGEGSMDTSDTVKLPGAFKPSNLNVCLNQAVFKTLKAGDHGALIKAYRKVAGVRESTVAFIIPVFVSVPHKELVGSTAYDISGEVQSFQVSRNYVSVPEGTTLVKVALKAAPAEVSNGVVTSCSGVELMALEAQNTAIPKEITPRSAAISASCSASGASIAAKEIGFTRFKPKAGIWDLHVFGRYNFANSAYNLKVDYAKIIQSVNSITGSLDKLTGSFDAKVAETTFAIEPSAENSSFVLDTLLARTTHEVNQKEDLLVPGLDGKIARSYSSDVSSVVIETNGAPGTDIDLAVLECDSAEGSNDCVIKGSSETATDVEKFAFSPVEGKFYKVLVSGYSIPKGKTSFNLDESLLVKAAESGTIVVKETAEKAFEVDHTFNVSNSKLATNADVVAGTRKVVGSIVLRTKANSDIINIPVSVSAK